MVRVPFPRAFPRPAILLALCIIALLLLSPLLVFVAFTGLR